MVTCSGGCTTTRFVFLFLSPGEQSGTIVFDKRGSGAFGEVRGEVFRGVFGEIQGIRGNGRNIRGNGRSIRGNGREMAAAFGAGLECSGKPVSGRGRLSFVGFGPFVGLSVCLCVWVRGVWAKIREKNNDII